MCVTREQSYGLLWNTSVEDQPWIWYACMIILDCYVMFLDGKLNLYYDGE